MASLLQSPHLTAHLATIARCRLVCREWAEWAEDGMVGALVGPLARGKLANRGEPNAAMVAWLERRVTPGQLDGLVGRQLVCLGLTGLVRAGMSWPPAGAVGAALVAAAAVDGATPFFREAAAAFQRDREAYLDVAAFAWRHYRDDALDHLASLGYQFDRPHVTAAPGVPDWFCGRPCPICQKPTIYKTCGIAHFAWPRSQCSERPLGRWRGTRFDDPERLWGQHDDDVDGGHMCPRCRIGFYACDVCRRLCRFIGGDGAWLARPGFAIRR